MNTDDNDSATLEIIGNDSLAAMERASIDCQVATARRYPRDFAVAKKKMLSLATLDEETAASCFYKLNRQGKNIEGPSVRMAEIAVSSFQNIRAGSRVIGNDGKTITAQGFCHDLENNVLVAVEVKRRITDKSGRTYSEDMQVVTGNAACAIAFRNAAYKVVPFALIKPVYEQAKRTAVGDVKTLVERRTNALKYFASLGVQERQVLAYLGKSGVDGIDLGDVENLIGLTTAIKEGTTSVEEAFGEAGKTVAGAAKVAMPPGVKEVFNTAGDHVANTAEVPPRATPLEGVRNLCAASGVLDLELVGALFKQEKVESVTALEAVPVPVLESVIADWEFMLGYILAARITNGKTPTGEDPPPPAAEGAVKTALPELRKLMEGAEISEEQVIAYCKQKKFPVKPIATMNEGRLIWLRDNFADVAKEIKGGGK